MEIPGRYGWKTCCWMPDQEWYIHKFITYVNVSTLISLPQVVNDGLFREWFKHHHIPTPHHLIQQVWVLLPARTHRPLERPWRHPLLHQQTYHCMRWWRWLWMVNCSDIPRPNQAQRWSLPVNWKWSILGLRMRLGKLLILDHELILTAYLEFITVISTACPGACTTRAPPTFNVKCTSCTWSHAPTYITCRYIYRTQWTRRVSYIRKFSCPLNRRHVALFNFKASAEQWAEPSTCTHWCHVLFKLD